MTAFHINDKGVAGACRAKNGKCPFGGFDDHFESKESAQKSYEEKQEMIALLSNVDRNYQRHSATSQALNSSLTYDGPIPKWLIKDAKKSKTVFGSEPEIIDIIEFGGRKAAVVWSENSLQDNDSSTQVNDGFSVSNIEYKDFKTGETLGYLKARYVDENFVKRIFGDDEYSGYRFLAGRGDILDSVDIKEYKISGTTYYKDELEVDAAKTDDEKLQAHKKLWVDLHKHFELSPNSNKEVKSYTLSENDAPNSIDEIKKDLKHVDPYVEEARNNFANSARYPLIDYSRITDSLRGQGLGASLYVYSARKLAEKDKVLTSSSIQSNEAKKFWKRLIKDKEIPVKIITRRFQRDHIHQNGNNFAIDFTNNYKKPERTEMFKSLTK